jgi:hypothetical protein
MEVDGDRLLSAAEAAALGRLLGHYLHRVTGQLDQYQVCVCGVYICVCGMLGICTPQERLGPGELHAAPTAADTHEPFTVPSLSTPPHAHTQHSTTATTAPQDELLASALSLVLSCPSRLAGLGSLLPALRLALTTGVAHAPTARVALEVRPTPHLAMASATS